MTGRVVLVGAGPGDPDLLTVRAARELRRAEVLLYDALIAPAILALAAPECERIDVGKRGDGTKGIPQDRIAARMIEEARKGRYVVRLKGGDPFVFGRGGEEASALADAGIPFEIVPGVSAALAVPAYAGIPVTDRRLSSSVAIVTGHRGKEAEDRRSDWEGLARSAQTLVILMGTAWLEDIVRRVLAGGRDPLTPAAVIASGTTGRQRVVTAPLRDLPRRVREQGLRAPTIILIGEVVRFRDALQWFESRPLFGRRVLILRAEEQRGELASLVAAAGGEPVLVPLLRFEASAPPEARAALAGASTYQWLVFTSANAVRFAAPHLSEIPAEGPQIACIGEATAAVARGCGLRVDLVPAGRSVPEELAAALATRGPLAGCRILLPRAADARDTLPEDLRARGARVDAFEVYRNVMPPEAGACLRGALEQGVDAVMITSPSTVKRLLGALGEGGLRGLAARAVLVCIGPTTAEALRETGICTGVVARRQSSEGLIEALERHYSEGSHALP